MKLFCLLLMLFSTGIFASEKNKEENLAKVKEKLSANYDKRISTLQTAKSCVQSATGHEQVRECNKTMKDSMKSIHQERKEQMKDFYAQRKEKARERKGKFKDKMKNMLDE